MRRVRRGWLVVVIVVPTGLAACSSDADTHTEPVATEAGETPVVDVSTPIGGPATTGDGSVAGDESSSQAAGDSSEAADTVPGPSVTATPGTQPEPPVSFDPPVDGPDLLGPQIVAAGDLVDLVVRPTDGEPFVVERSGRVLRLADDGDLVPVLDLTSELTPDLEWGLLGMAFAPDGAHAYLNETDGFETRIHEFPVDDDGAFDVGGRRVVYRFDQPAEAHNGGDLLFGPDGLLYLFNGDGGGDRTDAELGAAWNSDINRHALALDSPLGKILRIDPTPSAGAEFTVPDDNPFVDEEGALGEIWSIGVRNPWRNAFDPATGDLWVADVGNQQWEEISIARAGPDGTGAGRGVSFGWSAWEGFLRSNEDQPADGHLDPIHVYSHTDGDCSIVGGPVYRGAAIPELDEHYLFGDFCSGAVWAMELEDDRPTGAIVQVATLPYLVDIAADPDGVVYLTSIVDGVYALESAGG